MTFKPAVRERVPAIIALAGPTGSGKTYSAILLARGLAGPKGRIAFIDTENKRGRHYTHLTNYDIDDLHPPFTPKAYLDKIKEADALGYDVIIVDSGSHEMEGTGGLQEQADAIEIRTGKEGAHCWKKPKADHKVFMDGVTMTRAHIIFCLRARDKVKIMKNDKGKMAPVPIGMQPICEKNFMFEMSASFMMDEETKVPMPIKVGDEIAKAFPEGQRITVKTGELVRAWAEQGAVVDRTLQLKEAALRSAAAEGSASMKAAWDALSKPEQKQLAALKDSLKASALEADAIVANAAEAAKIDRGDREEVTGSSGPINVGFKAAEYTDDPEDPNADWLVQHPDGDVECADANDAADRLRSFLDDLNEKDGKFLRLANKELITRIEAAGIKL